MDIIRCYIQHTQLKFILFDKVYFTICITFIILEESVHVDEYIVNPPRPGDEDLVSLQSVASTTLTDPAMVLKV